MSWIDLLIKSIKEPVPIVAPQIRITGSLAVEDRTGGFNKTSLRLNTPTSFALDSIIRALIGDSLNNVKRIGVLSANNAIMFLQRGSPHRNSLPANGVQITTLMFTAIGSTGVIAYDALFKMELGGTVSRVLVGNFEYDAVYSLLILRPDFIGFVSATVQSDQAVILSVTVSLWLAGLSMTGATMGAYSLNANALRDWAILAFMPRFNANMPQYSRTYGLLIGTSFLAMPPPSTALSSANVTAIAYPDRVTMVRSAYTTVSWAHMFTISGSSTASSLLFAFAPYTLTLTFGDSTITHALQSGTLLAIAFSPAVVFDPYVTHTYTAIWSATAASFASPVLITTQVPQIGE